MDFNSRRSTKGLKKTKGKNEYYDAQSRQTFIKDKKGNLKMIVSDVDKLQHKATMERIRYYEKKYNYPMEEAKRIEAKRWKEYTDAVKKWNKGEFSRASTVARRYKALNENMKKSLKYYSSQNKQLAGDIDEKKKVMVMRMQGKHGVYNGQLYDMYIETLANKLGMESSEVEKILFPKGLEESSKYEDIQQAFNKAYDNIDDIIREKVEDKEISENDAFFIEELLSTGEGL